MTTATAVLFYGNCQALPLARIFRAIPAFAGYEALPVRWLDREQGRPERFLAELAPERAVLLVVGRIKPDDPPEWLTAALPAGVPVVRVASLQTSLLWPFHCRDPLNRPEPDFPFGRLCYGDSVLIGLRERGLGGEALFKAYMKESRALVEQHLPGWQRDEAVRLAGQDATVDVKVADLVAEAFAARRLFHTPNHPDGWLLRRFGARMVEATGAALGVAVAEPLATIEARLAGFDPLGREDLPVHPAVAEGLGLEWWERGMVYRTPRGEMGFRQYMRAYADE